MILTVRLGAPLSLIVKKCLSWSCQQQHAHTEGRGRRLSEFKASLVCRPSSRADRAAQRNPVSNKQKIPVEMLWHFSLTCCFHTWSWSRPAAAILPEAGKPPQVSPSAEGADSPCLVSQSADSIRYARMEPIFGQL